MVCGVVWCGVWYRMGESENREELGDGLWGVVLGAGVYLCPIFHLLWLSLAGCEI